MSEVLERRYARVLGLLPGSYRAARGEEMLGTLMDGAGEGQKWPHVGEVISFLLLAVRVRTGSRSSGSPVSPGSLRSASRIAALCGTFYFAAPGAVVLYRWARHWDRQLATYRMDTQYLSPMGTRALFVYVVILPLAWLAVFAFMIFDRRRTALAIALLAAVTAGLCFVPTLPTPITSATVAALTALAMVPTLGESLPRLSGRWWWLGALMAVTTYYLFKASVIYGLYGDATYASGVTNLALVVGFTLALVIGLIFAETRLWPVALAVIGAPFLAAQDWDLEHAGFGDLAILQGHVLEPVVLLAASVALLRVSVEAVLRRRRRPVTPT